MITVTTLTIILWALRIFNVYLWYKVFNMMDIDSKGVKIALAIITTYVLHTIIKSIL